MSLIRGSKQTLKTGVFLHLLQHFVMHDLPLHLVGCRKLLLGLYMVGVLLKITFDVLRHVSKDSAIDSSDEASVLGSV